MKSRVFLILFFSIYQIHSQEIDSTKVLKEVVVTGQFEPQSIKKSVFNVRLITAKDIQNLAANNLSDVLNQYINITIQPSGTSGRSTVSLFGLDAQYFKILVDNVPLVNEAGLGNNTDLSQINLNDIEQIEIVEGSMGVTHGANAVSGVLNIITKKASKYKWDILATVQEETIKDEYYVFDKGRHIQSLKVSHKLNNWFISLGANRNDFQGFLDDKKGKNHLLNDQKRGFSWLPKQQNSTTALISYQKKNFTIFYKFEYLDEIIDFYNSTVQSKYNTQLGSYKISEDKRYLTNRFFHNLNSSGKLFSKLSYNASISHQKQVRVVEDFWYYLFTKKEEINVKNEDQSMEVLYSTGALSNFFSDKKVDLQLGYEIVNSKGLSMTSIRKKIDNYDFFASSEINVTKRFSIRPGLRFSSQSMFKNQYASSLGLRYLLDKGIEVRSSYGKSFRTPSFEELYYYFVNDSHFYIGNENLIPETSTSYEIGLKKATLLFNELQISNSISGSFLDVNDRITQVFIGLNDNGIRKFQSINISKYRMWNVSIMNQLKKNNFAFNFGVSMIGVSQKNDNQIFASNEKYLYTVNFNCNTSYSFPKWNTTLSAYYKYNGKTQQFIEGSSEYVLSTIDASNWLDATIRKIFFSKKLETTIGARNILNITNINQTGFNSAAGHSTTSQIPLAYGRSYFIKLSYNLNF